VTLKRVLSLDFSGTRQAETLLGTGIGFHFRHRFLFIKLLITTTYFFFFGASIIIMRFPSNLGICSTIPTSSTSVANFKSKISPLS